MNHLSGMEPGKPEIEAGLGADKVRTTAPDNKRVKKPKLTLATLADQFRLKVAFKMVPLGRVRCDEKDRSVEANDAEDDAALMASLEKLGVIQSVIVKPEALDNKYVQTIAGKRRITNMKRLAARGAVDADALIPCLVVEGDISPAVESLLALTENNVRTGMTPFDQARRFATIREQTGCSLDALGKMYGISKGQVSEYLSLLKLPLATQADIVAGRLSAKAALRKSKAAEGDVVCKPRRGKGQISSDTQSQRRKRKDDRVDDVAASHNWPEYSRLDRETGISFSVASFGAACPARDEMAGALRRWLGELESPAVEGQ